jgi:hypothetical protein
MTTTNAKLKLFADEIELAVGYQIEKKLLAEAEPEETDEDSELRP